MVTDKELGRQQNFNPQEKGARLDHDSILIFNKFEDLESYENIEVHSAFDYEENTVEDSTSKSDGEVQSTLKARRKKKCPPCTVLTHSSAKQGTQPNKL